MTSTDRKTLPEEWLAGVAMVSVMLLGLWQASASVQTPAVKNIPQTWADFRAGVTTGAFSSQLDKNLPWRNELIAWANAGRYVLTHGAGDQVRLGRDEWLFSVEEIEYYPGANQHHAERLALLNQAHRQLKAQGVALVVALVPDKARVQAGQLQGRTYAPWYAHRYAEVLSALTAQGLPVVDLLSPLSAAAHAGQSVYYRTDTHWNQLGAGLAAQAVAQVVKATTPGLPSTAFETTEQPQPEERVGDLLRMMGLGDLPNAVRPNPDQERAQTTVKKAGTVALGLFDVVSVPVVLSGSSYSLRANFHGQLQQALGVEVLNVAKDGGGFLQATADYLVNEAFVSAKPQVLVWEIPERVFSAPLSDLERKGLPL